MKSIAILATSSALGAMLRSTSAIQTRRPTPNSATELSIATKGGAAAAAPAAGCEPEPASMCVAFGTRSSNTGTAGSAPPIGLATFKSDPFAPASIAKYHVTGHTRWVVTLLAWMR